MIKNILVPIDGSDHARKAVEYAADMGLKYKAMVHVVHVVSPLPDMIQDSDVLEVLQDRGQAFAQEILEEAVGEFKKKGVRSFQSTVLHGNPADAIIDFARKHGVDMIVMGSRGLSSVKELLLGSVSTKVCHLADCTCVTVK
jgi:nucleotide-binding universal stress UspA family protein